MQYCTKITLVNVISFGPMNWNDLKYVLATVRGGGLSGAARELGVNHATVSRRIAMIEAEIGAILFDRLPAGYEPTEAGLDAAKAAEKMEAASAELSRAIGARDQGLSGPLTVTAPQLLFADIINPIIEEFSQQYPDIDMILIASNETLNLSQREADVAIRISNQPSDTLFGSKVAGQRSAVYCSKAYKAEFDADPEKRLKWIRFRHWHGIPEAIKNKWPNAEVAFVMDDMVTVKAAVKAGMGASRMACFLGDLDPDLVRLDDELIYDYPSIWVLTHNELKAMGRVKAFMQFTSKRLRDMRHVFDGTSINQT